MDRRTTGIIATVLAVLLCGCPGLLAVFMGLLFTVISPMPGAEIDVFGSSDPRSALNFGIGAICVGALLVLIPIVVGFLTLRNRPVPATTVAPSTPDEPIPPAS